MRRWCQALPEAGWAARHWYTGFYFKSEDYGSFREFFNRLNQSKKIADVLTDEKFDFGGFIEELYLLKEDNEVLIEKEKEKLQIEKDILTLKLKLGFFDTTYSVSI